ncbi:MAG TPA: DegT/DnrJ/EryC1/StrS family aminotransferase [Candidatus Saccharimonadales bacterium]|nr:DegT/DnrJ/EryC1/StrS family aminotransferase [Candidatus Saccharimonadales bacterium]
MSAPHPTLRFSDVIPASRCSLADHHAPSRLHLTYNARAAIYQLLLSLPRAGRNTVLLPAYHCTALVEPVIRAGFQPVFYGIRPDFSIDTEDLSAKISSAVALTVVVHYFGFPTPLAAVKSIAQENGSLLLEDCAHSFMSRSDGAFIGHAADFAVFSYYKFAPSLAGGGLVINSPQFSLKVSSSQVSLRERVVIAKRLFEQAANNSPRNPVSAAFLWLDRLRSAPQKSGSNANSELAPSAFVDDPYLFREDLAKSGMPRICQRIIESSNWTENSRRRRENYETLSRLLENHPAIRSVFPKLTGDVVPWAYPILLDDRPAHERKLKSLGVPFFTFGEILHPALAQTSDAARTSAEAISRQLMLLPVHAQLEVEEIRTYVRTLTQYLDSPKSTEEDSAPEFSSLSPAASATEAARR